MSKKKLNDTIVVKCGNKEWTLDLFKEEDPAENAYKMYAEVQGLPGCIIAGDTQEQIAEDAVAVIDTFQEVQESHNAD